MSNKCSIILLFCYLLAVVVLSGCGEELKYPQVVTTPQPQQPRFKPAPAIVVPESHVAGSSVHNRPILCNVIGRGQDVTLILATIHGDEPTGSLLVQRLTKYLQQNQQLLAGRKVVLLPVANPDGMANNTRNNANGVNLNRNFSTANRINRKDFGYSALSEPETRTIEQLIRQYSPDRIVSIHQPMACIDYDGPAYSLANRMAQQCDLPIKKIGAQPGSLGSYAGLTLGIPTVTFEMTKGDSSLDSGTLWRKYGSALLAAITYPETVALK